jgi:uncharacterized damage-inducible protein DinB
MQISDLQLLYDYNYWANRRILDSAAHTTEAQRDQTYSQSWGSLQGTLVHTLSAEWIWRMRVAEGVSPTAGLREADLPTLEALRLRWETEEQAMRSFLSSLDDASLDRVVEYKNTRGEPQAAPLGLILTHVVNHGTQHRSEAAFVLTELGQSPGGMDYIYYAMQQRKPAGE